MDNNTSSYKLALTFWLLAVVPIVITLITESNKRVLIWHIRIVDFVDLVFIAPFFLIIMLYLQKLVFIYNEGSRIKWITSGLINTFMYGHAMHLTGNAINTYSTEINNYQSIIPPDSYELIYFFDEKLGHWLLYSALFLLLGIWMVESITYGYSKYITVAGLLMGVSYGIAFIESSLYWMGFVVILWLFGCVIWKYYAQKLSFQSLLNYSFVRFNITLAIFVVISELIYVLIVGNFTEPSKWFF